ncbi:hypothetical protein MSAN_02178200 [Mycena sanguinolenta]|uniref:Uncharacterized protein n=1 Tax=Mycena sanguinolenta TaxID=230812 RepID=A0A8H6XFW1_9AGAR|nr:hypothetical protein MSAN_02178200 [Mycena sanguinolenta]
MSPATFEFPLPLLAMPGVPLASSAAFNVGAFILMDAPCEKVWKILLDLPSYGKWNPFTAAVSLFYPRYLLTAVQPRNTLTVGKLFVNIMNIPPEITEPRFKFTSRVTALDHVNMMLTVEDVKTKWETPELLRGIWAYVVY